MRFIPFIVFLVTGVFLYENYLVESIDENYYSEVETINSTQSENILNYENIKIGYTKQQLINLLGNPDRIDESEYDFKWYVYNNDLDNFFMVAIQDDEVVGMYSNSLNSIELNEIQLNKTKDEIRKTYKPLEYKIKNNTKYLIDSNEEYDIIEVDNKYITLFYDVHNDNKICSYQIIKEKTEKNLKDMYPKESDYDLAKSFELQMIDLINSIRSKNGLNQLYLSENATLSSRNHSEDMMVNNFFDHTNEKGENPSDRMKYQNINYKTAGENIAAGQTSAIFAHEALMNSLSHRKNILGNYNYIGTGVVFGGYYNTYYTQNFYS